MMNAAVVLRGHIRTWNFCKDAVFSLFEEQYFNIDWYITTWRESITDDILDSLAKDFQHRNLFLHILEEPSRNYNAWTGPGKLCMKVADIIKEKQYPVVVETRPDIHAQGLSLHPLPVIEPNTFYTSGVNMSWVMERGHHIGLQDWFTISDANVFHIYSAERCAEREEVPHIGLRTIAEKHNLVIATLPGIKTEIVRPSCYAMNTVETHHAGLWWEWNREEKKEALTMLGIPFADYMTEGVARL